ncbi:hypothetical protein [Kitasatospora sp. NPDC048407]|uniref:hypothetical protein n=1 Tax=Kitasatospora sp. NPDC048407 TaxID=3364051 RepID=UPI0037198FEC
MAEAVGVGGGTEPAAAAILFAAHAYLFGCHDFAVRAGGRAVEAVDHHLQYLAELRTPLSGQEWAPEAGTVVR